MRSSLRLEKAIKNCRACSFVDKPFVTYGAYRKWLPEKVRVLAVGESPPPGRKRCFFYNLAQFDRLRLSMRLITGKREEELLRWLKRRGIFITAAVKCRPPKPSDITSMRKKCERWLRMEIELLRPERIVAMGRTAVRSLCTVLGLREPDSVRDLVEVEKRGYRIAFGPHPNYVFRFRRDISKDYLRILICE